MTGKLTTLYSRLPFVSLPLEIIGNILSLKVKTRKSEKSYSLDPLCLSSRAEPGFVSGTFTIDRYGDSFFTMVVVFRSGSDSLRKKGT